MDKIKDALSISASQLAVINEELTGVKHGLAKITSLQKQRSMEAKLLLKFRKEQEKKTKVKMKKKK